MVAIDDDDGARRTGFIDALRVQWRVLGALMLRELHTRFGRRNIGYLWLILEPMILSLGITVVHLFAHAGLPFNFAVAPFYASGYIAYITFRNTVNRAGSTIEANKTLMYHRQVTLLDLMLSRSALDGVSTVGAMIVVLGFFTLVGLSNLPDRPGLILLGLFYMSWFSWGLSMLVCAGVEYNATIERVVHPLTYLILPISGMFFVLPSLPSKYAHLISWFPIPQFTDLVRMGLNRSFDSEYVNLPYCTTVCAILTLLGLLSLRAVRPRIHFE